MTKKKVNLDQVSIAAPCPIQWEEMDGDERKRFCSFCSLHVYNIAEMKRKEAEDFLSADAGGVCLRLFRRADGTLITKDCPIGRRLGDALKRRIRAAAVTLVAMLNASIVFGQDTKFKVPDGLLIAERAGVPFPSNDWRKPSEPSKTGANSGVSVGAGVPLIPGSPGKLWSSAREQQADTTAIDAFRSAQRHYAAKRFTKAVQLYEEAIKAFREGKGKYDLKFETTVAKEYSKLLRQQKNITKAKLIEREFRVAK